MPTSRVVETPSGNGHLERKETSERIAVSYRLNVTQRMIPAGADAIPGLISITGVIAASNDPNLIMRLFATGPRERFTLCLEDNRKLDFLLGNANGSIVATGGFY
jgi:hypothetical protein